MQNNFIIGRITKDLEIRYTSSNKSVVDLPIAVNNGKDDTTYLNITVFDMLADNCYKYLSKGSLILAKYIIKNHNWEDKECKKHYDYSFIATNIVFLDTKKKEEAKKEEEKSNSEIVRDVFKEFESENEEELENSLPF